MVETPSSSDPGPDQGASPAMPAAQPIPDAQPSPATQPSEVAAAAASEADAEIVAATGAPTGSTEATDSTEATGSAHSADSSDTADTVLEASQEVVAEVISGAGLLIEEASAGVLIEEVSAAVITGIDSSAAAESPDVPSIAATLEVPPLERPALDGEGGEWDLLVEKVNAWFASGELQSRWQKIRGPLKGVAILIAVLLALRVYATVVGSIDGIPLVSGLLELTGLITLVRFALTKLVRRSEREQVLADWKRRWDDFRGDR